MRAGVRIGLYPDENESLDARGEGGKDLDLDLDLDFNFYSSEASKPVKLLHGCVLGRRDGAGSGGLSAVLTGDWSYLPSRLRASPADIYQFDQNKKEEQGK